MSKTRYVLYIKVEDHSNLNIHSLRVVCIATKCLPLGLGVCLHNCNNGSYYSCMFVSLLLKFSTRNLFILVAIDLGALYT